MTTKRELAENARSWPFDEARKLLARLGGETPEKGYALFETGYGPSGLPHIGTFGEVVRTTMVRRAFAELTDAPAMLDYAARQVDASHAKTSVRDLNDQDLRAIEDAMSPLLAELGFPDRWGDEPNNAGKTGVRPA